MPATPGNTTLGAINGLWGDRLLADRSELAVDMTVRHDSADVPVDHASLRRAFPDATGRLAVFVHGLCETEQAWWPSERKQHRHGAFSFGDRIRDVGFTPVYVRYNSGLHISDNGARLSTLLDELIEAWPVPVDEVALVGHSMGGLVARSACHHADRVGATWVERTRHVFGLGTPHFGAPLERGVNAVAWSLRKAPETRPLANVLNARSVGIKDLRFGSLLEDDWTDVDLDGFLTGRAAEVPFLEHVNYYFVAATVTRNRRHPLGLIAGDLLVQFSSASGTRPSTTAAVRPRARPPHRRAQSLRPAQPSRRLRPARTLAHHSRHRQHHYTKGTLTAPRPPTPQEIDPAVVVHRRDAH